MWRISGTLSPTPLPWLPVLTNTEPPALRMKDDRLIETILAHENNQLTSKRSWRDIWMLAAVINSHTVAVPTIQQPVFDLCWIVSVLQHLTIVAPVERDGVLTDSDLRFYGKTQTKCFIFTNLDGIIICSPVDGKTLEGYPYIKEK